MCFLMPPIPIILKHSFHFLFGSHNHFMVKLKVLHIHICMVTQHNGEAGKGRDEGQRAAGM